MSRESVAEAASRLYARGNVCLAPMVRAGTLPLRLLSLRYGADVVYGEEIIAFKVPKSERHELPNGFVEYRVGKRAMYMTCPEEQGLNVFQLGAADATSALLAARHVVRDVAALDLNMGCPKHFSIQGGMGAALLRKPEVAADILSTLRRNLNVPVTCKIRILDSDAETVELMRRLESAGAMAIGVHVRHVSERPKDRAHWDRLALAASAVSVPVMANGDVWTREDMHTIWRDTDVACMLLARGALRNPSVFRGSGRRSVALFPDLHEPAAVGGMGSVGSAAAPVATAAEPPCGGGCARLSLFDKARREAEAARSRAATAGGGAPWPVLGLSSSSLSMSCDLAERGAPLEAGDASMWECMQEYFRLACALDNHLANTKYTLMVMMRENMALKGEQPQRIMRTRTEADLAAALGLEGWHADLLRRGRDVVPGAADTLYTHSDSHFEREPVKRRRAVGETVCEERGGDGAAAAGHGSSRGLRAGDEGGDEERKCKEARR